MKLTKHDRAAFVASVMNDVPTIDYREEAVALVMKRAVDALPPKVKAKWSDATLRGFLRCEQYRSVSSRWSSRWSIRTPDTEYTLTAEDVAKLKELGDASSAQDARDAQLRADLTSAIAGCSTLKQAIERLPEFAKYLPPDRDATGVTSLPAISNVVAALVKAGWPKDQEPK